MGNFAARHVTATANTATSHIIEHHASEISPELPVEGLTLLSREHNQVTLAIISDTHAQHDRLELPERADILIHCGDIARHHTSRRDTRLFNEWLGTLKERFPYRVVVGGNHDYGLTKKKLTNATHYLCDTTETICGLRVHGAPWTPARSYFRYRAQAFTANRRRIQERFQLVPRDGLDILITHGPPLFVLDEDGGGCPDLAECVVAVKPRLHLFGHKHRTRGARTCEWNNGSSTLFVNAASVSGKGKRGDPMHPVVTIPIN